MGPSLQCQHTGLPLQVLLRHKDDEGRALVHATSWWNAAAASSNLRDPSQPIWVSLTQAHKELYREIQTVQLGNSATLESHFGEWCMLSVHLKSQSHQLHCVECAVSLGSPRLLQLVRSTRRCLWAFLGAAVPVLAWWAATDSDSRSVLTTP